MPAFVAFRNAHRRDCGGFVISTSMPADAWSEYRLSYAARLRDGGRVLPQCRYVAEPPIRARLERIVSRHLAHEKQC